MSRSYPERDGIRTDDHRFKDSDEHFCGFQACSHGLKIRVSVVQLRPWAPFFAGPDRSGEISPIIEGLIGGADAR